MSKIDNHKFYKKAYLEYGISARGVHWNSKYTQYKRFEILTSFIKNKLATSSIVDAGCGFAEYLNYLKYTNLKYLEYSGLDCEDKMIEVSKKRFKEVTFLKKDIIKDTLLEKDYYICSGALNLLSYEDLKSFIENCFKFSKKGFVFNYLENENFVDISKSQILNICMNLSSKVDIKDGYLYNDYTIFVEK